MGTTQPRPAPEALATLQRENTMKADSKVVAIVLASFIANILLAGLTGIGSWLAAYFFIRVFYWLSLKTVRKVPSMILSYLATLILSATLWTLGSAGDEGTLLSRFVVGLTIYGISLSCWMVVDKMILNLSAGELRKAYRAYSPTLLARSKAADIKRDDA